MLPHKSIKKNKAEDSLHIPYSKTVQTFVTLETEELYRILSACIN